LEADLLGLKVSGLRPQVAGWFEETIDIRLAVKFMSVFPCAGDSPATQSAVKEA